VAAVDVQLGGQVGSGHALSDPAQDLQDNCTGVATFAKESPSEEVEDGPALAAAIVGHDAMAVVGGLLRGQGMPVRTL
jgi:hypothetical protein